MNRITRKNISCGFYIVLICDNKRTIDKAMPSVWVGQEAERSHSPYGG